MSALTKHDGGSLIGFDDVERMSRLAPVVGFEGLYSASDDGRVWAHPKASRLVGRWLKERTDNCGYRYVCLFKAGVRKYPKVHRVVMMAFSADRNSVGRMQVNHINGRKDDNRLSNLEWVTASENRKHAWATGLQTASPAAREAARKNISNWNTKKMGCA